MNPEFLINAAQTQEKLGRDAALRGDEATAKRKFDNAAQKYREAAKAVPSRQGEFLGKAMEMESLALGAVAGAKQDAPADKPDNKSANKNVVADKQTADKKEIESAPQNEKRVDEERLSQAVAKLNDLIGLSAVKKTISEWIALAKNFDERRRLGYNNPEGFSYHMAFSGNPGTGKTTVARLMADICLALGIVSKGQLVEVGRDDIVAGYVGQTAIKMAEVIEKARGGVLFIDEVYSLSEGGDNDFGKEATNVLVQKMENYRDDLVVIGAGYLEPMKKFLGLNVGLPSRFKTEVIFDDYNGKEMYTIFEKNCQKCSYVYTDAVKNKLLALFDKIYEQRDSSFANGRTVRNIFETIISRQAVRLGQTPHSEEDVLIIKEEDIPFNV